MNNDDSPIIIALDFKDIDEANDFIDKLNPKICKIKIGSAMFTRYGSSFVKKIINKGFKVFLDLKFHDIPNTVAEACSAAADLGVWMLNVHALGGVKMMEFARKSLQKYGKEKPILIAVTLLTSHSEMDLLELGLNYTLGKQLNLMVENVIKADLGGIVCSASDINIIKNKKNLLYVTPGIRCCEDSANDQVRVVTPEKAIIEGSNYIVIGRSITNSQEPMDKINKILKKICKIRNIT